VNIATREKLPALEAQRVTEPAAETVRMLQQQEQLVAELLESSKPQKVEQPKAHPTRPRTEGQAKQRNG